MKMLRLSVFWWARTTLLAALVLVPVVPAQEDEGPEEVSAGDAVEPAKMAVSARGSLRAADDLAAKIKGLRGPNRAQAQQRALDAYRATITTHPAEKAACAEAWFEIGELARKMARLAEAEEAYGHAIDLDFDRYGERALLQLAHVLRRLERGDEALAHYRKVADMKPGSARAHTARVWIARSLQAKGDLDGAAAAYGAALDATTDAQRAIDLCNGLAQVCLARGDLEGATGALGRADKLAATDGPNGAKLRKAVESMSARRALQRLRDKAAGAAEDARQLELDTAKTAPGTNSPEERRGR